MLLVDYFFLFIYYYAQISERYKNIQLYKQYYTQLYKNQKHKKHRRNMTQITSPQTWQMNSKSVP